MNNPLMSQGLELMLYGMGTVVVFLALLVVITTGMSRLLGRYFPEPVVVARPRRQSGTPAAPGDGPDKELVAAIGAAIRQHRKTRS